MTSDPTKLTPELYYYRIANKVIEEYDPPNLAALITRVLSINQEQFCVDAVIKRWNKRKQWASQESFWIHYIELPDGFTQDE